MPVSAIPSGFSPSNTSTLSTGSLGRANRARFMGAYQEWLHRNAAYLTVSCFFSLENNGKKEVGDGWGNLRKDLKFQATGKPVADECATGGAGHEIKAKPLS